MLFGRAPAPYGVAIMGVELLLHGSVHALLVRLAISAKFAVTLSRRPALRVQTASAMGDLAWFFHARSIGKDWETLTDCCSMLMLVITCFMAGLDKNGMRNWRRRMLLGMILESQTQGLLLASW